MVSIKRTGTSSGGKKGKVGTSNLFGKPKPKGATKKIKQG